MYYLLQQNQFEQAKVKKRQRNEIASDNEEEIDDEDVDALEEQAAMLHAECKRRGLC
jgi:ribosomal protein L16 Arg81 hydroxylase